MLKQFRMIYGKAWKITDWYYVGVLYAKMWIVWALVLIRFAFQRFIRHNTDYEFISFGEWERMIWHVTLSNLLEGLK